MNKDKNKFNNLKLNNGKTAAFMYEDYWCRPVYKIEAFNEFFKVCCTELNGTLLHLMSKDGKPKKTSKISYHATCLQMLRAVIDKSLKDSIDFTGIAALSANLTADLLKLELKK